MLTDLHVEGQVCLSCCWQLPLNLTGIGAKSALEIVATQALHSRTNPQVMPSGAQPNWLEVHCWIQFWGGLGCCFSVDWECVSLF